MFNSLLRLGRGRRNTTTNRDLRLEVESLEPRLLLDSTNPFLTGGVHGVFENPKPESANFSQAGKQLIVFGTAQSGSKRSAIFFSGSPKLRISNDATYSLGKITYQNGKNVVGSTITSASIDIALKGVTKKRISIPISIDTSVNTGNGESDADALNIDNVGERIEFNTGNGIAYMEVEGFKISGIPETRKRLRVAEDASGSAKLMARFYGFDRNDDRGEATDLGTWDSGNRKRTERISHVSDVDVYELRLTKNQRITIDIDTPGNGASGLNSYLAVYDQSGKKLAWSQNNAGPGEKPGKDSYLNYLFEEPGFYYIAVSNFKNTNFDVNDGGGDFHTKNPKKGMTGKYTLTLGDVNDQKVEALDDLKSLLWSKKQNVTIDLSKDVDLFKFRVRDYQRVGFDIDDESGRTWLTLFDENGKKLANATNQTPRERGQREAYLEYKFQKGGTYYIAVSGFGNNRFNMISGAGDRNGKTGKSRLEITPITRYNVPNNTTFGSLNLNSITGVVQMPNPGEKPKHINVSLRRVRPNGSLGGPIKPNIPTWIVTHGRTDSFRSFTNLAGRIAGARGGSEQVLVLDWEDGSFDNSGTQQLGAAEWIPFVSQWASDLLKHLSIPNSRLYLTGHSLGTYISYEIAKNYGGVRGLVAMDPAFFVRDFGDYPWAFVNFRKVAELSWAFYGNGLFGSEFLANKAHESYTIDFEGGTASAGSDSPFQRHSAPIRLFEQLVSGTAAGSNLFSLDRLVNRRMTNFATLNIYRANGTRFSEPKNAGFEGYFNVSNEDGDDQWTDVDNFYFTNAAGKEVRRTAP